jgi:hypothetical protein
MNTSKTNTISDSVLGLQLEDVHEKAKKSLTELKELNASIDKDFGEFLDDDFDPKVNKKSEVETDKKDDKDLEAINNEFTEKAWEIFKDELGE